MDDGAVELKVLGMTVLRDVDGDEVQLTVAERRLHRPCDGEPPGCGEVTTV